MKKLLFALFCAISFSSQAQDMLQQVITDYTSVSDKNKFVKVNLPTGTSAIFYRITVFQREKVNTTDEFKEKLRLVDFNKLKDAKHDFSDYKLISNTSSAVDVTFFSNLENAETFRKNNKAVAAISEMPGVNSTAGKLDFSGKELFVGIHPTGKDAITVKLEIAVLAEPTRSYANDRYPYEIQNETNGEVAYEVSGDRTNWETFRVPTKKRADFKLAAPSVYLRVSTEPKSTEEYFLQSDKKYRFFWNADKSRVDLKEMKKEATVATPK